MIAPNNCNMKIILTCFLLLISFVGNAQNKADNFVTIKRQLYTIKCPSTWRIDTVKNEPPVDLFMYSPRDTTDDNFSENINIIIDDQGERIITLDQYIAGNEKQVKEVPGVIFVENKRYKQKGVEFHKFILSSQQATFQVTTIQYYFVHKTRGYIVTLSADANKYNKYKAIGEKIMNSFQIKR